ncbi:hypothetical protein [Moraxella caviae]|nr:hypothetical protein [Moraxella caviae]
MAWLSGVVDFGSGCLGAGWACCVQALGGVLRQICGNYSEGFGDDLAR